MEHNKRKAGELPSGADISPRHESWARISSQNTFASFIVAVVIFAMIVVLINAHFSATACSVVGVVAVVLIMCLMLMSTPRPAKQRMQDAERQMRIEADLTSRLGNSKINVHSLKGVVTLRGTVPYANFRGAAEQLAWRGGARRVINQVTVDSAALGLPISVASGFPGVTTPEGAPRINADSESVLASTNISIEIVQEQSVREALEASERVHANLIYVRVENAIAYLTGRQESVQESDAATEVAAQVEGILGVSNDIEVMPSY